MTDPSDAAFRPLVDYGNGTKVNSDSLREVLYANSCCNANQNKGIYSHQDSSRLTTATVKLV